MKATCKQILTDAKLSDSEWRVGLTKIFLREELHNKMEDLRKSKLNYFASYIQRYYKTYKLKKKFSKLRGAAVALETAVRKYHAQKKLYAFKRAATTMQATVRGIHDRRMVAKLRKGTIIFQKNIRVVVAKQRAVKKRKQIKKAQAVVRMHQARMRFKSKRNAAIAFQKEGRAFLARKTYRPQIAARLQKLKENNKKMSSEERKKHEHELEEMSKKIADEERARQERERKAREEKEREEKLKNDTALEEILNEVTSELQTQPGVPEARKEPLPDMPKKPINADDFESTMAELQNFINGEMFSTGASSTGGLGLELEKGISLDSDAGPAKPAAPINTDAMDVDQSGKAIPFNVYLNYNNYKLQDYAMNHFNQHAKSATLRLGKQKKVSWTEMLQHTKSPVPTSILQFRDDALVKEAIDNFTLIMKYMGDISAGKKLLSKAPVKDWVQDIIGKALSSPELRDEFYCQLCKQTTKNPKL
jgi:hypothetical protein